MDYRYEHFHAHLLFEDMRFRGGPQIGDPMPPFNLPTTDGGRLRSMDFLGWQPMLMTLGSITCPMTRAARDGLLRLHRAYGDRVAFVTLYVREAHPGDLRPQPHSMAEKMANAAAYKERDGIPWTVAVDDLEGSYHRLLDPKPASAYLVNQRGRVVFRSLWSNDEGALRYGFEALLSGRRREKQTHLVPLLAGFGALPEAIEEAGPEAELDLLRAAPPLFVFNWIAKMYRPLPPAARGVAAALTLAAATAGLVALGRRVLR